MHNATLTSSRRHRLAAWLALLAMLMIFIAPVVSQSLAMAHAPGGDIVAAHTAAMSHHDAAHAGSMSHHDQSDHDPVDHSDHGIDQCGYCTLLTQLPALGGVAGAILNDVLLDSGPARLGRYNRHVTKAVFPTALPRAPPLASFNLESLPGA